MEIYLETAADGRIPGFDAGEDVFAFFQQILEDTLRQKEPAPGLCFKWRQDDLPSVFNLNDYLGPVRLKPEGAVVENAFNFGPEINIPSFLRVSPRGQTELSLAVSAVQDYLTPPLGAPETRGQKALILSEGPALLPLATRLLGSGELFFAFSRDETASNLKRLLEANPDVGGITPIQFSLPSLIKIHNDDFQNAFSLIASDLPPGVLNRHLKSLSAWLKVTGRLVLASFAGAQQISISQKAAEKSGLVLYNSVYGEGGAMLSFVKPRPRDVEIWEWSPGDWVKELNEEDRLILERIAGERAMAEENPPDGCAPPESDAAEGPPEIFEPPAEFESPSLEITDQDEDATDHAMAEPPRDESEVSRDINGSTPMVVHDAPASPEPAGAREAIASSEPADGGISVDATQDEEGPGDGNGQTSGDTDDAF
ncbi:MAG: hypothetical protein LBR53_01945 [Deltaproteobacteria bacterium]|nr:hypothetical protein [Deltaproteobacteria bacterium]